MPLTIPVMLDEGLEADVMEGTLGPLTKDQLPVPTVGVFAENEVEVTLHKD